MVLFNYATKEITAKVVYYGPGLCGKTTNLQFIHSKLNPKTRGKLLSLATETDRTLFFDFLPLDLGSIRGYRVRFQLYTVPGQVHYNATRKLVLKGADAVIFVADSQMAMMEKNVESFENLRVNMMENGLDPDTIPLILQYNKRDLPNVIPLEELNKRLNSREVPCFESVATTGEGVLETLKAITKALMADLRQKHEFGPGEEAASTAGAVKGPELPERVTLPPKDKKAAQAVSEEERPPSEAAKKEAPAEKAPSPAAATGEAVPEEAVAGNHWFGRLQEEIESLQEENRLFKENLQQLGFMFIEQQEEFKRETKELLDLFKQHGLSVKPKKGLLGRLFSRR